MSNYHKTLNLILMLVFLFSCNKNNQEESSLSQSRVVPLSISDHGTFHNEAILTILEKTDMEVEQVTMGEVLRLMSEEMSKKHPEKFSASVLHPLKQIFDFDQNFSDFKFDIKYYESLKAIIGKENIDVNLLDIMDKAFYKNEFSPKDFSTISSKTESKHWQLEIFKSYYTASEQLWTQQVGKEYLVKSTSKGCDPSSQVIIADAVGGTLIGILTGGAGAPLGGGAVSLAVRQAQIEEYGGGCIE